MRSSSDFKYTLGYKSTLKAIRGGKAKLILLSSNVPPLRFEGISMSSLTLIASPRLSTTLFSLAPLLSITRATTSTLARLAASTTVCRPWPSLMLVTRISSARCRLRAPLKPLIKSLNFVFFLLGSGSVYISCAVNVNEHEDFVHTLRLRESFSPNTPRAWG